MGQFLVPYVLELVLVLVPLRIQLMLTQSTMAENELNIAACLQEINSKLSKLDSIENKLTDLATKVSKQDELITDLTVRVNNLDSEIKDKDDHILELEQSLAKKHNELKNLQSDVLDLGDKVNDLEQYSKRDNLLISGMRFIAPYNAAVYGDTRNEPNATESNVLPHDRDIMAQNFVNFVRDNLKVEINIGDITDIHTMYDPDKAARTKPRTNNKPRPVLTIVRFNNRRAREKILRARKALKNANSAIYINEHLTKLNADLFRAAREAYNNKKFLGTWTVNGRVFVKSHDGRITGVSNKTQLKDLLK